MSYFTREVLNPGSSESRFVRVTRSDAATPETGTHILAYQGVPCPAFYTTIRFEVYINSLSWSSPGVIVFINDQDTELFRFTPAVSEGTNPSRYPQILNSVTSYLGSTALDLQTWYQVEITLDVDSNAGSCVIRNLATQAILTTIAFVYFSDYRLAKVRWEEAAGTDRSTCFWDNHFISSGHGSVLHLLPTTAGAVSFTSDVGVYQNPVIGFDFHAVVLGAGTIQFSRGHVGNTAANVVSITPTYDTTGNPIRVQLGALSPFNLPAALAVGRWYSFSMTPLTSTTRVSTLTVRDSENELRFSATIDVSAGVVDYTVYTEAGVVSSTGSTTCPVTSMNFEDIDYYTISKGNGELSYNQWDNVSLTESEAVVFYPETAEVVGGILPAGTFTHIEISQIDETLRFFINGKLQATTTLDVDWLPIHTGVVGNIWEWFSLGSRGPSTEWGFPFKGWIDAFRITAGVVRHTSDFVPPTAEASAGNDPHWDNVICLMKFDEAIDATGLTTTVTPVNSKGWQSWELNGAARTDSNYKKFGTRSLYLDGDFDALGGNGPGSSAAQGTCAFVSNYHTDETTGKWTIDFWVMPANSPSADVGWFDNPHNIQAIAFGSFIRAAGYSGASSGFPKGYGVFLYNGKVMAGFLSEDELLGVA